MFNAFQRLFQYETEVKGRLKSHFVEPSGATFAPAERVGRLPIGKTVRRKGENMQFGGYSYFA